MSSNPPAFDSATIESAGRRASRNPLHVIPGGLVDVEIPDGVAQAVDSLLSEIRSLAYLPIADATALDEAVQAATNGFLKFCDVWPAVLMTVAPWMVENKTVTGRAMQVSRQGWESEQAVATFGEIACANWAAAESAREMLGMSLLADSRELKRVSSNASVEVATAALIADYAIGFAKDYLDRPHERPLPNGFAEWFSLAAMTEARRAYALAMADNYEALENTASSHGK